MLYMSLKDCVCGNRSQTLINELFKLYLLGKLKIVSNEKLRELKLGD